MMISTGNISYSDASGNKVLSFLSLVSSASQIDSNTTTQLLEANFSVEGEICHSTELGISCLRDYLEALSVS